MNWYRINAAAEGPAELNIYGDIGESWWAEESITAKSIAAELKPLAGRPLTVRINSYGGSVSDGLAIFNALRRHAQTADVTTSIEGVAMSIASLIAMAGDRREIAGNAMLMIHAPWGVASGNARDMRDMADVLDRYAEAMTSAYTRSAMTADEVRGLLTDGADHFYSAAEAEAAGLATHIVGELAIAAIYRDNRFTRAQAHQPESHMTQKNPGSETPADTQPDNVVQIAEAAARREAERIQARAREIRATFEKWPEFRALMDACLDDLSLSVADSQAKLLKAIEARNVSDGVGPTGQGSVHPGPDARDKFKAAAAAALAHRMGAGPDDRANELRGKSLTDLAAMALEVKGHSTRGMTRAEIASKVLASHSTSDFPLLLADAANKSLQAAYGAFPQIWDRIAAVGSVSDFKTINLIKLGSFSSLSLKPEGAEYTQGTLKEEREQLTARTKGKFIQCTREMLINDDLSAFSRMAQMLGRAAARTVNADVIGVLTTNGNTADGYALFSTDHANYTTSSGTAISIASLVLARKMMRLQKDPNALDYLNIMPRYLLTPVGKEDHAREVIASVYNTDTTAQLKRNPIQDWSPLEVLSDPLLDASPGTGWYLIADPMDMPLLEVRFLDGQRTPFVEQEEEFLTDAVRWKVRLDYGVGVNEWRAGYHNTGA